MKAVLVVAGIIRKGQQFLIAQRKADCRRERKWEFPGGKVEEGETPQEALRREIMEELGVRIKVGGDLFCEAYAERKGMRIRLQAYPAEWVDGEPRPIECKDFRWAGLKDFSSLEWASADLPIVRKLEEAGQ